MKTIVGITILGIGWLSLLIWMLVIGFQSTSLVDVFTLGGTFSHFDSGKEIFFTFAVPLIFVFILGGTAIGMIASFKDE